MKEGRREWECDLRDDSSRWELTHVTKHSPRISPYRRGGWGTVVIMRVTRAEHSRRFLSLNYAIEYVTTHLQEISQ